MAADQLPVSRPSGASSGSSAALRMRPADQRIVLHVGCGAAEAESLHQKFRGPDWREVRLDLDPSVNPDVLASIIDMRQIADGSADAVWSSHNLEHLSAHEVPLALREFFRVLKPGGFVLITLPDLQQVAEFIVADKLEDVAYESPAGPITPLDCVFGLGSAIATGHPLMAHRTGFTEKTLRMHLQRAGFGDVRISFSPFALWAEAVKPCR
jgi:ubiquinone/menaquinone biosynthesis C-methylase UbiE